MPNPIKRLNHLIPVKVAPRADDTEGRLEAVLAGGSIRCLFVCEIAHDLLAMLLKDHANKRLVAANQQTGCSSLSCHRLHFSSLLLYNQSTKQSR